MSASVIRGTDGPGCGHDLCLFERHCLVLQADVELREALADRARMRENGRRWARAFGLSEDKGLLLEVIAYSSSLPHRERAAVLLTEALSIRRAA